LMLIVERYYEFTDKELIRVCYLYMQCVEWPLKYPQAYSALGLRLPRGILLHGPPGCAKTSLVRAAAASCHVNFLAVSGAQLYSPYLGEAEKKIAEVCSGVVSPVLQTKSHFTKIKCQNTESNGQNDLS